MTDAGPPHIPQADVRAWRGMLEVHARVMDQLAMAFKGRHGLSVSDFDVLINMPPRGSIRHRDLAECVVLSRSALTRLVDRLETRGYVTREPVAGDDRGVHIALTPRGRTVREDAGATNDAIVHQAFAPLGAAENARLLDILSLLGAPSAPPKEEA